LDHATELFDAIERCTKAGERPSEMTILVGPSGQINMLADCDWPLESLLEHRGAGMVYRISRHGEVVRLEGRAGTRTCLFETAKPDGAAPYPSAERPERLLRPAVFSPGPPLAASARLLQAASGPGSYACPISPGASSAAGRYRVSPACGADGSTLSPKLQCRGMAVAQYG